ncbi:hypothetical protein SORBI_3003G238250 [Sorghum bicolor]|uniref:Uncharacterized protein n=1 Tax=Sorghum bicolor TaxID=4558 RepID=A0A1W0VYN4_SORBI|nr:hypothetical protein SORBI_3003G238250 [Sorghum bicolor]
MASRTHFAQLPVHLAPRNRRPCDLAFAGCLSPCLGTRLTLPGSLCRATARCAPASLRLPTRRPALLPFPTGTPSGRCPSCARCLPPVAVLCAGDVVRRG